ncbi:lipocalin family protein [Pseudohalioglobus lutimaris]|uniref:Outer membrane lipoprotein Blc n=1 Tax=Pseudohalioglobus lutimaris TaxID=1737061 RepID=A0A2N5WXX0_9GAMM|nr:lipocalin family protein [Pseudohalioglobus lutimaris]PLW67075.1 lipocalin [Pseudohalioglobus lutimaris]
MRNAMLVFSLMLLSACLGMPEQVRPVTGFEAQRYMGKWYEIARLDHRFERGMTNVTADYTLQENGGVSVVNRGYLPQTGEWKEAVGKAYFVEQPDTAYLKVSFFGPFYGSYVVFGLDKEGYQHAFVSGPDHSYLWFLSRTPVVDEAVMDRFLEQAGKAGFDTGALILVDHGE